MSQTVKIAKALIKSAKADKQKGMTVAQLVKATGVDKDGIYRRISDLCNEGFKVERDWRIVNNKRKLYYRLAS